VSTTPVPPHFAHPAPPPERPERPEGLPDPATGRLPAGTAGWKPWSPFVAFLGVFVAVGLVGAVVLAGFDDINDPSPEANIGLTYVQDFALIAAALLFAAMVARPRGRDFGLRPSPFWRAVGVSAAVGVGFYVFAGVWSVVVDLGDQEQTVIEDIGALTSDTRLVFSLLLITVMAPLGEELFFRGYMFPALRNGIGLWGSAIVTGVVFGAIHFGSSPVATLVPLAFFGFGLCLLYAWTGSLYPPIALHAFNNALAFGVSAEWSFLGVVALMVGAMLVSLGLARLLGRLLGDRPAVPRARADAPPSLPGVPG
jgi:membrane protease YdiL (CAAX protease family)